MPQYEITQLPTKNDKVQVIGTTKERYLYGPGTILLEIHEDGSRCQVEYDYMPDATPESLIKYWNEKFGRNAARTTRGE